MRGGRFDMRHAERDARNDWAVLGRCAHAPRKTLATAAAPAIDNKPQEEEDDDASDGEDLFANKPKRLSP